MVMRKKSQIRTLVLMLIGLIVFGSGQHSFAQQSDANEPEDFFEMSLEELMDVEVLSASRQTQKIGELSVPVSVITSEDIHYSGLTSIPEVLQFTPGVDVLQIDRNRYAVGVRGLHEVYSDRLLSLTDGRAADSITSGGPRFPRLPILIEDIDRIEVVRGPGGATWGANAFTGVVNIITKDPEDCLGWLSSTNFNYFGDSYSHVRWAAKEGKWSWRQSVGYESQVSSDDAIDDDNFSSHDFSRNWRFDGKAIYHASEVTKASFGLGYSNLESGDFEFGNRILGKNNRLNSLRSFARVDHEYEDGTSGYLQLYNNLYTVKEPALLEYSENENDIEGQLNFAPSLNHQMSIGGNFRWIRIDGESSSDPQEFVYRGVPLSEYWAGLFATDRWQATDRLTLEGQIRGDWYSETQTDWSTRLTGLYGLDSKKDHILRLSLARAFRAPTIIIRDGSVYRIAHPFVPGTYLFNLVPPTDELKNESTYSVEAGYTGKVAKMLTLRVDGYYQRFEDLVGFRTVPDPLSIGRNFFMTDNIDGADSWGTEVELVFKGKATRLSVWYAYNDFETDQTDQPLRAYLAARHKVGLTGRLFLDDDWILNLNYKFMDITHGEHANPLNPVSPNVSNRLDLTVAKRCFKGNGELMIGVSNLLEKDNDPVPSVGALTMHETPGRMFFVRMQLKF